MLRQFLELMSARLKMSGMSICLWQNLLSITLISLLSRILHFFLNFGCLPKSPADIDVSVRETESEDHANNIKLALQRARQCMKEAQHEMAKQANEHRRHVEFKEGDFILLRSQNLKLQFEGSKKLMQRYFGPFKVLKRICNLSYEIETPASMKCHDVFHVSLLKIYKRRGNLPIIVPPPALLPTGHKEFEIERITDHRVKEYNFPGIFGLLER